MVDAISSYAFGNLYANGQTKPDSTIKQLLAGPTSGGQAENNDVAIMFRAATRQSQAILAGMQATSATSGFHMYGEDGGFGNIVTMMQKATDWIEAAQDPDISAAELRDIEGKFNQLMSDFTTIAGNSALTNQALLEGVDLASFKNLSLGTPEQAKDAEIFMTFAAAKMGQNFDGLEDKTGMSDLEKAQMYLTEALTGASSAGLSGYNATGAFNAGNVNQLLQGSASLNLFT